MSARLVALAALLFAAPATMAQPTFGARVSVFSTGVDLDTDGFDPILGAGVSVFVEADLAPYAALGLDLGVTQAGFSTRVAGTTEPDPDPSALGFDASVRATYLSFAPTVTGRLPGAGVAPYAAVGPRLDLRVAERSRVDGAGGSSEVYDGFAVGLGGAVGVAVPLGPREVRADVRASTTQPLGDNRQTTVELRLGATL